MGIKSTNKELVADLELVNVNGKFDKFVEQAKNNFYHDYKQPDHIVCGKTLFVNETQGIPELKHLRDAIINGEYDEVADEEDKASMRKDLPPNMWAMFGLNPSN